MDAYCCHCHKKTTMKDETLSKTKTGQSMMKGLCSVCSGKVCKFVAKK